MFKEDKNVTLDFDSSKTEESRDDSIMNNPVSDEEVSKKTDNSIVLKKEKGSKKINAPIEKKYAWTIKEAAAYSGIGEQRLREIARNNPHADYLMHNGVKTLFKRDKFLMYLDSVDEF